MITTVVICFIAFWLLSRLVTAFFAPIQNTRRKLMIASWSSGSEATIFGGIEINVTETQKYIQKVREATGEKVTITHVTILAIAKAMEACPSMNGRLIFEYFFPHKSVDIGCLVALDDGKDLANVKITDCNTKSLVEIAQALAPAAKKLREGKDEDFKKVSSTLRAIPSFVMPFLATFTGFLAGAIGLDIPAMGVKPFPFGSAMVTSIGMLGLEGACVPFTPFARVPALCCVGKISDKAVVEDGKVVVRPMVSISGTLDHRFLDGTLIAKFNRVLVDAIQNPANYDTSLGSSS